MCLPVLPEGIPDPSRGGCCPGAVIGPRFCTCWHVVYDLDQAGPDTGARPLPPVPVRMCRPSGADEGCAYRAASPERRGDSGRPGGAQMLGELVASGVPFWCHAGIRRVIGYVHEPTGTVWDPGYGAYDPPVIGGVPYQAGGQPAMICAGWLLRRYALTRQQEEAARDART
jgi:hypothetical protein